MHRRRRLQLCALSLALTLLSGAAGAQTAEPSSDAAPSELPADAVAPELPADAPLDLSTPEPDAASSRPSIRLPTTRPRPTGPAKSESITPSRRFPP
jgi:hypothetical protein